MYEWFLSLKQPDGSFLVSQDSEVDVRGIYCLLCVASLLNLTTPALIQGTAAFIASLQTYEGGFACSSHPYFSPTYPATLLDAPRPPLGEAHGGYTFCALASWVMLLPFLPHSDSANDDARPTIDIKRLTRWCVQMQGASAELGGFRGRTNKLVDACYAWWVGGCFALLRGLGVGLHLPVPVHADTDVPNEEEQWTDADGKAFLSHIAAFKNTF